MSRYRRRIRADTQLLRLSTGFASVTLLLFFLNLWLIHDARQVRRTINEREVVISDGNAREQLSGQISKTLVDIAINTDDDRIRTMLRAEGVPEWKDALRKQPLSEGDTGKRRKSE